MTDKPRVDPSAFNGYPCTVCGATGPANDPMLPYGAHMCRIDRVEPSYKPEVAAESVSAQLDREFGQRVEHAAECRCDRCKREAKGVEGVGQTARELAKEIVLCVAELPGRSSPEDWPEAMIVTDAELREIAMDVIATYLDAQTLTLRAELQQAREALRFIAEQENLTFAECSLAEEIVRRAKAALGGAI